MRLRAIAIAALMGICTLVSAQTVTVTTAHFGGITPATGTMYWWPTTQTGAATSYQLGGGGQSLNGPIQVPVVNGAATATLPDTALTAPANLCFNVTFEPPSGGPQQLQPGYSCVQPTANNGGWCGSSHCNFDNYVPNLPAQAQVNTGPFTPTSTGTVTVMAALLGSPALATGTIYFWPQLANGTPASAQLGSGGQSLTAPITAAVVNGRFSATLPDTNITNPKNLCFKATFEPPSGGSQLIGPGYSCLQPAANNGWCASRICNLDLYIPNTPVLALVQPYVMSVNGQTGVVTIPTGSVGDSDVLNQTASQGTVNLLGTVPASGKYRISYNASEHALCGSGFTTVYFSFTWNDGNATRTASSRALTLGAAQLSSAGMLEGTIQIWATASSSITYTSTLTGSCASGGPSSYDAHISVESVQ